MKNIFLSLLVAFSLVATSCGNAQTSNQGNSSQQQAKGTFSNVSVKQLNTAITENPDVVVLDVRTPGELREGYIENALNYNVNGAQFKSQVAGLDKSKTTYVYCRSGHRSQAASRMLIDMGFTDVRNVEGGFIAWAQSGYKMVK